MNIWKLYENNDMFENGVIDFIRVTRPLNPLIGEWIHDHTENSRSYSDLIINCKEHDRLILSTVLTNEIS